MMTKVRTISSLAVLCTLLFSGQAPALHPRFHSLLRRLNFPE